MITHYVYGQTVAHMSMGADSLAIVIGASFILGTMLVNGVVMHRAERRRVARIQRETATLAARLREEA